MAGLLCAFMVSTVSGFNCMRACVRIFSVSFLVIGTCISPSVCSAHNLLSLNGPLCLQAVAAVKNNELASEGVAAMYGMVDKMPDKGLVTDFLTNVMNDVYT